MEIVEYKALEDYLSNRFGMATTKDHAKLVADVPDEIRAHAFFLAKVSKANVLERIKKITHEYILANKGKSVSRAEILNFLVEQGYDPTAKGLKDLASKARLDLILKTESAKAYAIGEYQRMHDPDIKAAFPNVIYRAVKSGNSRDSHSRLDGKVFSKDDPFLQTHTPPWDFNCKCYLEDTDEAITDNTDLSDLNNPPESGFSFRPDLSFQADDMGLLNVKDRAQILKEMTDLVRKNKISKCTFLGAEPATTTKHKLSGLSQAMNAMQRMENDARDYVKLAGLDPDNMPNHKAQGDAFELVGMNNHETIPKAIKEKFGKEIVVGDLSKDLKDSVGLVGNVRIVLKTGDPGLSHTWKHHKEMFTNVQDCANLFKETIGNSKARAVFAARRTKKEIEQLLTLHNPETKAYCTLKISEDGKVAELMSWHRAEDAYGNKQWASPKK